MGKTHECLCRLTDIRFNNFALKHFVSCTCSIFCVPEALHCFGKLTLPKLAVALINGHDTLHFSDIKFSNLGIVDQTTIGTFVEFLKIRTSWVYHLIQDSPPS